LREHQWRVRLAILVGEVAATPEELRRCCGAPDDAKVPADLLLAAAATGPATGPAFLDIMDGGCFVPAPCLCCYSVRSPEHMREATAALRLFQEYHDPAAFVTLRSYGRAVATLARDLHPDEVIMVQKRLSRLESTSAAVREIHRLERSICVAVPACQPNVLWVYSTPAARRLLRHIARTLGRDDAARGTLSVAVASSSLSALPRYRYRMYSATLNLALPSCEIAANANELLLAIVLDWARARRTRTGA
jgi:hypothetical protein